MINYDALAKVMRANVKQQYKHLRIKGNPAIQDDKELYGKKLEYTGSLTCLYCNQKVVDSALEIKGEGLKFSVEEIAMHMLEKHANTSRRTEENTKGGKIEIVALNYETEEGISGNVRVDKWALYMNIPSLDKS